MSDDLTRLRNDISVMQQAAGFDPPFDRLDARNVGLSSLLGLPLVVWGLVGTLQSPYPELAIVATLLAIYGLSSYASKKALKERHERPLRWREHKLGLLLVLLLTSAALAYLAVSLWHELSWSAAMATGIFFAGVSTAAIAMVDRNRVYLLGGAIPTVLYGAFFPLYDSRGLLLATACWIIVSALATAAIMFQQLRYTDSDS